MQAFFLSLFCYLCKCHQVIKDSIKVHYGVQWPKVIQKNYYVMLLLLTLWLRCVDFKWSQEVSRHIGQRKLWAFNSVKWGKVHSWYHTTKFIEIQDVTFFLWDLRLACSFNTSLNILNMYFINFIITDVYFLNIFHND